MLPVDDFPVIGIFKRMFSEHFPGLFPARGEKILCQAFMDQHVIGGHAGLPAVQELPENNTPCRGLHLRGCQPPVYNHGAFPSELQCHRSQMLRCLAHDQTSYRLASGKENIVELLLQQIGIHIPASFDHCYIFFRKYLTDDVRYHG